MSATDSLSTAVATGDRAKALAAVRDDLAQRIAAATDRDAAALVARLVDVLDKLAALPASSEGTALDEFTKRRAARADTAPRRGRAARGT